MSLELPAWIAWLLHYSMRKYLKDSDNIKFIWVSPLLSPLPCSEYVFKELQGRNRLAHGTYTEYVFNISPVEASSLKTNYQQFILASVARTMSLEDNSEWDKLNPTYLPLLTSFPYSFPWNSPNIWLLRKLAQDSTLSGLCLLL